MAKGMFGDLFDLDRDGDLKFFEEGLEFEFANRLDKNPNADPWDTYASVIAGEDPPEDDDDGWRDEYAWNDLGVDPIYYDSKEEFLEACEEKELWLDNIDEATRSRADKLFVDPTDYDSYDEFIDAIELAEFKASRSSRETAPATRQAVPKKATETPVPSDPTPATTDKPTPEPEAAPPNQETEAAPSGRSPYLKWIVLVSALLLVVLASIVSTLHEQHVRLEQAQQYYVSAQIFMEQGDYESAFAELDAIRTQCNTAAYLDAAPLHDYCEARIRFNRGDADAAYALLAKKQPFAHQSVDFILAYNDFFYEVEAAHNQNLAEQAALEAQKKREQQQREAALMAEFRERLKGKLPYIGMAESYINDTALGKYSKADIGKTYSYYTFYINSSSYYYVTCENGKVISANQFSRSTSSGSTSKSSSTKKSDPYDVYDYSDPDDFYYDHYDDFWEFEDAEDYFYDHVR